MVSTTLIILDTTIGAFGPDEQPKSATAKQLGKVVQYNLLSLSSGICFVLSITFLSLYAKKIFNQYHGNMNNIKRFWHSVQILQTTGGEKVKLI